MLVFLEERDQSGSLFFPGHRSNRLCLCLLKSGRLFLRASSFSESIEISQPEQHVMAQSPPAHSKRVM